MSERQKQKRREIRRKRDDKQVRAFKRAVAPIMTELPMLSECLLDLARAFIAE
jgi:hypothetical protein